MKRIIIRTLIAIVAVVALLGLVGLALDPGVNADVSIKIARPPEKVFAVLADMESIPKWSSEGGKDFKVVKVSDQPKRFRATMDGIESSWEILEEVPPRLMRSRMEAHTMGVSGEWRTEVAPADGGASSQIHHQVAMKFSNPWLRVLSRMMDANKEEAKTLEELKRYLESQ
jgi:uncharacterized protein YndB with AHSA1/START domain